jgi:carbonic anhydrase
VDTKAPHGPYFEVAIVHRTDCGSRLLEDDQFRHDFAERGGYDEQMI